MRKKTNSAICIQALAPLSEQDFSDFFGHFEKKGATCDFEQRQSTSYASLDWLIPTGIILFITHSYFDGIFKEVGKDHYHWLKTALPSLYKKALGESPEFEFAVVSAGKPKTPLHFSGALSLFYTNDLGYRVKLLFPLDITADDYALSCEEFVKLIAAHEERLPNDSLGKEIEFQAKAKAALTGNAISIDRTRPTVTLLVFWSRHDNCFHVADTVASSRSGKLISREISRAQL